jgi:glutamate dehydrogenase (NADP+)
VAIYAAVKAIEYGATVVAMSDSNGYIGDQEGIDIDLVIELKEKSNQRIKEYIKTQSHASYHPSSESIWNVACDIALPCATQNELNEDDVLTLVKNGVIMIAEGANMPCTSEAIELIKKYQILYIPGIASNAGGVAVSALEMSQNVAKQMWSFEEVDTQLQNIMNSIYDSIAQVAKQLDQSDNLMLGAQLAGYFKVVEAMKVHGIF